VISRKTAARAGASFFAVPAALVMAAGPSVAAGSGDVLVTNTETVQAYLNASGRLEVARVYEQVAMKGKGTVELSNPVESNGLRNLDEFGGFEVRDGNAIGTYEVDGEKRLRTVSDFTRALPLDVDVTYTLDGKEVKPGDVVGRSGVLKVQYTVRNVTGKPQEVTFDDGTGTKVTATEDVVIPMVGSLTTVLPSTFTDVRSAEANMAGDGRGGTKMSFTMTLFGPIGKPEATFGYEAQITDGVVPKASISALPVSPLDSPSFKGGAESYKGGAQTGATLTAGATEIDANLLKLRDGAGELLAGLIQLRDGANQLNAGLSGEAAPGAKKLADGATQAASGAGELSSGVGQLDDGAKKLSAGSKELAGGTGQLAGGADRLAGGAAEASVGADTLAEGSAHLADGLLEAEAKAPALLDGLTQVSEGLTLVDLGLVKMYQSIGELDKNPGVLQMHQGMQAMITGLGSKSNEATLIGGVEKLRASLAEATKPGGSLDLLKGGVDASAKGATDIATGIEGAVAGVNAVKKGHDDALASGGSIDQVETAIKSIKGVPACGTDPLCIGTVDQVAAGVEGKLRASSTEASAGLAQISGGLSGQAIPGLQQISGALSTQVSPGLASLQTKLAQAVVGLTQIECGLSNTTLASCDASKPGLLEGIGAVDAGLTALVNGVISNVQGGIGGDNDTKEDATLRGGVHSLQEGVGLLSAGGGDLLTGLGLLSDGAGMVAEGNAELADGVYQIAGGADELSAGADKLDAGAGQLSDGAGQLADGTGKARDGAGQLADGNRQIADGANQLSSGLGEAADGSGQIAEGLEKAAEGAPQLEDGAQRLSDEGTKKLVEAGKSTAADYGQKYALIEAGAQRAKAEGMAYGAPADAAGNTAYSFELAGMSGEGSRNLGRGLGAAAVFGLAGAAAFLRRRFI
jgi:X-X-X-Leu-X-X-Gly heptad repeat protein